MHVHLPNSAFLGNIDPFIRSLDLRDKHMLEISANKKWISVHPVVLCMVAALGLTADKVDCEKLEAVSKHYLARMRLFKVLGIPSQMRVTEHGSAGKFVPLTIIKTPAELSEFVTNIIPLLHLVPEKASAVRYVVSELVRNVLEHAYTPDGAIVAAQYYKKSNTIRIGIVDNGVGIKKTIRTAHFVETDLEAIRLALTPGITGTTRKEGGTELNAGAGLFFIRSIAQANNSFFMIYSGNAMYKLLKPKHPLQLHADPFKDRHSSEETYTNWQGTAIGVDIALGDTVAFSTVLDEIRETYIKSIKERKQHNKKREARFI